MMKSNGIERLKSAIKYLTSGTTSAKADEVIATKLAGENAAQQERHQLASNIFSNGRLPTNFSINLGAAPCNHSCLFCPQSIKKPAKAAWLDMDLLRKVVSEMPETDVLINISSYSETLAAPNLVTAIKIIKELRPKLEIVMATNGSLFKERVVRGLIEAGLDHYSYSFDAPDRKSYERLMQVDHFDRVWNNLEQIVALRAEYDSPMRITTHIMGFEEFRSGFESFREQWKDKVDDVIFRPVGNWGGETWGLEQQLAKGGFHIPEHQVPTKRLPCNSIFMHFKLQHDGRYAPCVAAVPDYSPEEEMHDVAYLGDASSLTWTEAWERLGDMRRAHLGGNWDSFACCKTCNIWSLWPAVWQDAGSDGSQQRFDVPNIDFASKQEAGVS
jgi:pyruvate-formate lyase-activating enzyme